IAFPSNKIYVLTEDKRIQNFCKKNFIPSFITSKKCKTGTDRIFEIKNKIEDNEGRTWYEIHLADGREGWISGNIIKLAK
ncbi:MAG: hypothetical protein QGG87_00550, partial [Nitrospinota bacterium]|nr:hypothetical protein [Nitrospinota bacterium]